MTGRTGFLILSLSLLLSAAPPALAGDPVEAESAPSIDDRVVYDHEYALERSRSIIVVGERLDSGGCVFTIPDLTLEPGQSALEARPVETDFRECVQEVEIGEPPSEALDQDLPAGGTYATEQFSANRGAPISQRSAVALAASGTDTAYYEIRWHDLYEITTTRTRAYLEWSWNGSCVTSSSAWGNYWWFSASGWSKIASSGYKTSSCTVHKSIVDWAHYRNNTFCDIFGGANVNTYVDNAQVHGTNVGGVSGGFLDTWTTEIPSNPYCPNLHYHVALVR